MVINTVIEIHNVNIIKRFVKYLTVYVITKYIFFIIYTNVKNPFKILNFLSSNFFFVFLQIFSLDLHSSFIQICDFRLHFTSRQIATLCTV